MTTSKEKIFSIISGVIIIFAALSAYYLYSFSNNFFLTALNHSNNQTANNSYKGVDEKKMNQVIQEIEKKIPVNEYQKLIELFE